VAEILHGADAAEQGSCGEFLKLCEARSGMILI
jgi:hypothetical protein